MTWAYIFNVVRMSAWRICFCITGIGVLLSASSVASPCRKACSPANAVGMPSFLKMGCKPYLTTLSLQRGFVPLRLGNNSRLGLARQWFARYVWSTAANTEDIGSKAVEVSVLVFPIFLVLSSALLLTVMVLEAKSKSSTVNASSSPARRPVHQPRVNNVLYGSFDAWMM